MHALRQKLIVPGGALLAMVAALTILLATSGTGSATGTPETVPYFSLDSLAPPNGGADLFETHSAGFGKPATFAIELAAAALGLAAGDEVDAVSGGNDWVDAVEPCHALGPNPSASGKAWATPIYYWSVQRGAVGSTGGLTLASQPPFSCFAAGNPIATEGADGVAADIFFQVSAVAAGKVGAFFRANVRWRDEAQLGLRGSDVDNLDALQSTTGSIGTGDFDVAAEDGVTDVDVFFSVDAATAVTLGVSEADILLMPAGGAAAPVVYAAAAALGLQAGDDIDALCLEDGDTNFANGARALISLAPGSPSLAAGPYTAGDAFKVGPADPFPGSGIQVPFLPFSFLSLAANDNLDALFCGLGDPAIKKTKEPPPESEITDVLITAIPAQVDNGVVLVDGFYIHCRADVQLPEPVPTSLTVRLYCYDDNPAIEVNPENAPGEFGDGLPGTGPPLPYGDVNGTHTELTGFVGTGNDAIQIAGCFNDPDLSAGLGNAYWEIRMYSKPGGIALGTVDIWTGQDAATCQAGAALGSYVGSPTADPTFDDASFYWNQLSIDKLWDDDGDGVPTAAELQDDADCGRRDPYNPYDFYDVSIPRDGVIDLPNDILGVILHFAPGGYPPGDENWDRPPVMAGAAVGSTWNRGSPDGVIDLPNDILGVILQFNPSGC